MRILVYGINYHPELIGIGKYTTEMCEWLTDQGNTVEVVTAMPSYPNWKIHEMYRGKWWFSETINSVKIHRCPLYVPANVTGITRILHEVSFGLSSLVFWIPKLFKRYDVVICIAPPLQLGLAGVVYRAFRKTLFIYHIQDLQLDAARQLGLIKNRLVLTIVARLEKFLLTHSDYVSSISNGMIKKIAAKGVPNNKILSFKNWIDTNSFFPTPPDPDVRTLFGIAPDKKIVLYSGNIGEKQGIEMIINVAELIQDENVVFVIIGDGAFKAKLINMVQSKKLMNVQFFPLQPQERLRSILNSAYLHLVLQKRAAADLVMPSKLTGILAVGGAAIVSADEGSTLYEVVSENKMGVIVTPEDVHSLQQAIETSLCKDLTEIKHNARQYAQQQLDKEIVMKEFYKTILDAIQRGPKK